MDLYEKEHVSCLRFSKEIFFRFSHEVPPVMVQENGRFDKDFDFNLIDSCLATSFIWSSKEIMIDLLKEGFDVSCGGNVKRDNKNCKFGFLEKIAKI